MTDRRELRRRQPVRRRRLRLELHARRPAATASRLSARRATGRERPDRRPAGRLHDPPAGCGDGMLDRGRAVRRRHQRQPRRRLLDACLTTGCGNGILDRAASSATTATRVRRRLLVRVPARGLRQRRRGTEQCDDGTGTGRRSSCTATCSPACGNGSPTVSRCARRQPERCNGCAVACRVPTRRARPARPAAPDLHPVRRDQRLRPAARLRRRRLRRRRLHAGDAPSMRRRQPCTDGRLRPGTRLREHPEAVRRRQPATAPRPATRAGRCVSGTAPHCDDGDDAPTTPAPSRPGFQCSNVREGRSGERHVPSRNGVPAHPSSAPASGQLGKKAAEEAAEEPHGDPHEGRRRRLEQRQEGDQGPQGRHEAAARTRQLRSASSRGSRFRPTRPPRIGAALTGASGAALGGLFPPAVAAAHRKSSRSLDYFGAPRLDDDRNRDCPRRRSSGGGPACPLNGSSPPTRT